MFSGLHVDCYFGERAGIAVLKPAIPAIKPHI